MIKRGSESDEAGRDGEILGGEDSGGGAGDVQLRHQNGADDARRLRRRRQREVGREGRAKTDRQLVRGHASLAIEEEEEEGRGRKMREKEGGRGCEGEKGRGG